MNTPPPSQETPPPDDAAEHEDLAATTLWFGKKGLGQRFDELDYGLCQWHLEKAEEPDPHSNFLEFKRLYMKFDAGRDPGSISMWFGNKHKGRRVDQIPYDYVVWVLEQIEAPNPAYNYRRFKELLDKRDAWLENLHRDMDDGSEDSRNESTDDTHDEGCPEVSDLVENVPWKKLASASFPRAQSKTKRGRISQSHSVSSDEDEDTIFTPTSTPVMAKVKGEFSSTQDDEDDDIQTFQSTRRRKRKSHNIEEERALFLPIPAVKRARRLA